MGFARYHWKMCSRKMCIRDRGRLKLRHVVVLGDHLDQLVTGDEKKRIDFWYKLGKNQDA